MGVRVLFGVFDWGLGHATRDMPLIAALLERGHSVDILATGRALRILMSHFGLRCEYHEVPSISPPYTRGSHFGLSFLLSAPQMLHDLHRARKASKRLIRAGGYDLVVSDCRFDVYDKPANSFLINHQLRFKAFPGGQEAAEAWLAYRIARYGTVLVPDFPAAPNLSGMLGHEPTWLAPEKLAYLGILSHLPREERERDIDLFISLTGPEPQRTVLEEKVLEQVATMPGRIVIAGGHPERHEVTPPPNVEYHAYLDAAAQGEMMNRARAFVSRSGYTTMMELAEIGMPQALLIPTPGQTEQEYLADYYEEAGLFHHVHQDALDLPRDLVAAAGFLGFQPPWRTETSIQRCLAALGLE